MIPTARAAAPIDLPIEVCWSFLRDLTRATNYVPGLTKTVLTTEKKEGVGASRVVSHRQFGDMDETVIEWREGIGFSVRLHKGDSSARPFKEAAFRYSLEPSRTGRADACEIHTALTYELPFGVLGRALDSLFLGKTFQKSVLDTAVCLAEHYQTGEAVPPERIKALRLNALPL